MPSPYIVAELGASHLGSFDRAESLIHAAKKAGADAVKLQCWTPGTMAANPEQEIESGPWKGKTLGKLYEECHTKWIWFDPLFTIAAQLGIDIFSSVFDLGALEFLESIGNPRYKISSFEITDLELIRACAKTGKPLVISTGMATRHEIVEALLVADLADATVLACTSAYPAEVSDANLARLEDLLWMSSGHAGISDHTMGHVVPVVATALGATMIEKHLTLSRADGGPDASFSMEPEEFAEMVRYVRQAALALGEVRYGPKPSEQYVNLRRGPKGRGDVPRLHAS